MTQSNMTRLPTFEERTEISFDGALSSKGGLTYIAWADAWKALCLADQAANYEVHLDANGLPYHTDGQTVWVDLSVTAFGKAIRDYCFPLLDHRNQPIRLSDARMTSAEVNNAIQRGVTKLIARHGIGLSVYQGQVTAPTEAREAEAPKMTPAAMRNRLVSLGRRKADVAAKLSGVNLKSIEGSELEELLDWATSV